MGAAKQMLSTRSSMPPCPRISRDHVSIPKLRLMAAITILPQKPNVHSSAPMAVPCHTENGVMNDNAAASATD